MLQLQMNGMLRRVTIMHGRYEFMHTHGTCLECAPSAVVHSHNNGETAQGNQACFNDIPNELITHFGNKDMSSVIVIHAADLLPPGAPKYKSITIVLKDTPRPMMK